MDIVELRAKVGQETLGDPRFDGSAASFRELEPNEQIEITNRMKEFIRNNPDGFTENQLKIADTPDIAKQEDFTISDAVGSFTDEFKRQAEVISEKGTNRFFLIASVVGIIVGIAQLRGLFK